MHMLVTLVNCSLHMHDSMNGWQTLTDEFVVHVSANVQLQLRLIIEPEPKDIVSSSSWCPGSECLVLTNPLELSCSRPRTVESQICFSLEKWTADAWQGFIWTALHNLSPWWFWHLYRLEREWSWRFQLNWHLYRTVMVHSSCWSLWRNWEQL